MNLKDEQLFLAHFGPNATDDMVCQLWPETEDLVRQVWPETEDFGAPALAHNRIWCASL
jgi:hypothetical protein